MERPRILSGAIAALRESSLTAWFVAAASGPAMSYASWEFLGYRGLLPGAIAALSITFAARIVTDRHLAPTAPPTRRRIATATAAALPVIATAVGGIVLAPFATYGTAYHLSCLPYIIYGCDASPPPAVVVATLVALAVPHLPSAIASLPSHERRLKTKAPRDRPREHPESLLPPGARRAHTRQRRFDHPGLDPRHHPWRGLHPRRRPQCRNRLPAGPGPRVQCHRGRESKGRPPPAGEAPQRARNGPPIPIRPWNDLMNRPPHNRELEPGEPLSRRSKPAPQSAKTPSPAAETPQPIADQ